MSLQLDRTKIAWIDRLENILNIFKRGMGKRPTAEIENKEIT